MVYCDAVHQYLTCASIFNTITYNTCDTKTQNYKKKWNEKMRIYIVPQVPRYHLVPWYLLVGIYNHQLNQSCLLSLPFLNPSPLYPQPPVPLNFSCLPSSRKRLSIDLQLSPRSFPRLRRTRLPPSPFTETAMSHSAYIFPLSCHNDCIFSSMFEICASSSFSSAERHSFNTVSRRCRLCARALPTFDGCLVNTPSRRCASASSYFSASRYLRRSKPPLFVRCHFR